MTSMRSLSAGILALILATVCGNVLHAAPATLTVAVDKPGVKISPLLWGIFFEDINLSADGGIYPELVRNRSFEDSDKPDHWQLVNQGDGRSEMTIDSRMPLNPYNRSSLRVRLDGVTSLINEGYWGMSVVQGETYNTDYD